ncbi:OsmC family protein [Chryseobacterium sp. M5A1_1a]
MSKEHHYKATIQWTGNKGTGTSNYRDYERSHIISVDHKINIEGSSDPSFRGDKTKYNPEEMFLSSLSSCHMLWYLHFCSEAGIIVTEYIDEATGTMAETSDGSGHFTEVTLHPKVTVADRSMMEKAEQLHHKANEFCFIANSVNFLVKHIPIVLVK